jgi:hypothetical protein
MTHYIVKFYKKVLAHGHEMDVCQYLAEERAECAEDALVMAKRDFCAAHDLRHWRGHADRVEVKDAEFPS